MRGSWIAGGLIVAAAAAALLVGPCAGPAADVPPESIPPGATGAGDALAPATQMPAARRETPRAARPEPGAPESSTAVDAVAAAEEPESGDPVRFEIVVPQGTSMADVRVRAWQMRGEEGELPRRFVALGRERTPGPDGVVTVLVKDREGGVILAYARAPGLHTWGEAASSQNEWTARIVLGPGIDVEGAVTDAEGRSVAGAEVRLVPLDRAAHSPWSDDVRAWAAAGVFEFYGASVTTDANGLYRIRGVPTAREGRTPIEHLPIARDAAGRWWRGETLAAGHEAATFVCEIQLGRERYVAEAEPERRTLEVEGKVVDDADGKPVAYAIVAVVIADGRGFSTTRRMTQDDGSFGFSHGWTPGRTPAEPELVVRANGYRTIRRAAKAEPVEVRLTRDDRGEALGAVRVRAVNEGARVSGPLRVLCRSEDDSAVEVTVIPDAEGRFRITGLAPGWWELWAGSEAGAAVFVRPGEEAEAVLRDVRWEPATEPWTEADEAELERAQMQLMDAMQPKAGAEEAPRVIEDEQRVLARQVRQEEVIRRVQELDARKASGVARRPVRVRGITASGPAWLRARCARRFSGGETWTADVRSAEASFPALYAGSWTFELTRQGGAPDQFTLEVPEGTGEIVLDAALAER